MPRLHSEASAPLSVPVLLKVQGRGWDSLKGRGLEGLLGALYHPLQEQFHILVTDTAYQLTSNLISFLKEAKLD